MLGWTSSHLVLLNQYELVSALNSVRPSARLGNSLPLDSLLLVANDWCESAQLGWRIDRPYGTYQGELYRRDEFGRTGSGQYRQVWRWEGNSSLSQTLCRLLLFGYSNGAFDVPVPSSKLVRGDPEVTLLKVEMRE